MAGIVFALIMMILVPAVIIVIIRRSPAPRESERPYEALHCDYRRWYVGYTAALCILVGPAMFVSSWVLHYIMQWRVSFMDPAQFEYIASWVEWGLPGFPIGVILVHYGLVVVFRVMLGSRLEEFSIYCNRRAKYDSRYVEPKIIVLALLVAICLAVPPALSYMRFCEDKIQFSRVWWFGQREYSYGQISEIARVQRLRAPSGKIIERPHYMIIFDDGVVWNTDDSWGDQSEQYENDSIDFILNKTMLKLGEREFAP